MTEEDGCKGISTIQSTPDVSNLQGKLKKVRVIEGKII